MEKNKIKIYTDGSCSGNPGPMGIGAVLIYGKNKITISENKGNGTSNRAEIMAVIEALKRVLIPSKYDIELYIDSQLVYGFIELNWNASVNKELVLEMRKLVAKCNSFKTIKVKGHSGNYHNNLADKLAVEASHKRG